MPKEWWSHNSVIRHKYYILVDRFKPGEYYNWHLVNEEILPDTPKDKIVVTNSEGIHLRSLTYMDEDYEAIDFRNVGAASIPGAPGDPVYRFLAVTKKEPFARDSDECRVGVL